MAKIHPWRQEQDLDAMLADLNVARDGKPSVAERRERGTQAAERRQFDNDSPPTMLQGTVEITYTHDKQKSPDLEAKGTHYVNKNGTREGCFEMPVTPQTYTRNTLARALRPVLFRLT